MSDKRCVGFTLKRFRPRAQGRGFTIRKRTSSITLVLSDDRGYRSNGPRKAPANKKAAVVAGEGKAE